jgi:hypothetical protein
MRLKFLVIVLLAAFGLAGCGGDDDSFVITGTSNNFTSRPLHGKLFLGQTVAGVPITVEGLDGRVLAQSQTDGSGNFTVSTLLPAAFRVRAALSDDLIFAREIRGFDSEDTFASITIPTTMASLLAQANPGQPLDAIEAQVRELLVMPTGSYLGATAENVAYGFSHLDFYAKAANQGGVRAYLEQILTTGQPPAQAPFLLRLESLAALGVGTSPQSASGLEQELANVIFPLTDQEKQILAASRLISRGVNNTVVGALGFKGTPAQVNLPQSAARNVRPQALGILKDTLGFVGNAVGSAIIGQVTTVGTQAGYTWIAEQLGGHFGTAVELDEILADLEAIADDLTLILSTLDQETLDNELADMVGWSNDIVDVQNSLVEAFDDAKSDPDYFDDLPGPLSPTVQSTLQTLKASSIITRLESDINQLTQYLTGAATPAASVSIEYPPIVVNTTGNSNSGLVNVLTSMRTLILNQNGIVPTAASQKFANFPVRSSYFLDQVTTPLEGHARSLVLGAHMMGEAGHQSLSPTTDIPKAQAYADNVAKSLQNIRAQLPGYPTSDNYFIDLENGLMWYMVVQSPQTTADAEAFANSFTGDDGNTRVWRLPTWDELKTLQVRAAWAASGGASFDHENTALGLQKLGFDTTNLEDFVDPFGNDYGPTLLAANWTYDNGIFGSNSWNLQTGDGDCISGAITYNLFSSSPTPLYTNETSSFVMCRTLGSSPCLDIDPPLIITGANAGTWPGIFAGQPLQGEEPSVAILTGMGTASVSNGSVVFSDVEWTFNVGATEGYTVGNGSTVSQTYSTQYERSNPYTSSTSLPPIYFQTNDSAGISVSSYPSSFGQVTPHANSNESSDVNAFSLGLVNNVYPSVLTTSFSYATESPTPISLKTLQITPRNQTVDLVVNPSESRFFLAVGFYSDRKTANLTPSVTWTATDAATGDPAEGVTFVTSNGAPTGEVLFTRNGANIPPLINLTATINDSSGNPTNVGSDTTLVAITLP